MSIPIVLLVDDEPSVVEGLKLRMRSKQFQVITATSAKEALELLTQHEVRVVVSDERMPGMQGSEFLSVVADSFPDTTRIILTGQASVEAAMRAINHGRISHFLTKPCDAKDVKALIERALAPVVAAAPAGPSAGQMAVLERLHPGISEVKRDESGAVVLDDDEDVAA